jgi:pyruvate/2-oxoglutarate dehydrogenase complex dihydrolipoamide dehydrogenase (E3) component
LQYLRDILGSAPEHWREIYAIGHEPFTHTSYNDFEIVAANILDDDQRSVTDRITAHALYTDPPLGRVGMTEAEVRKTGRPALISTMPMEDVSRAFEKGETKGFMKILVDRESKQILGASFLGLAGDEVIHCILALMYAKAPYTVMQRAMHIHPTVSEFIPTMIGELKPLQCDARKSSRKMNMPERVDKTQQLGKDNTDSAMKSFGAIS